MTELLSRPDATYEEDSSQVSTTELQTMFDAEGPVEPDQETEQAAETHDEPPLTDATSRVGRILQRIANQLETGADQADVAGAFYNDTKEKATKKIKGFGRSALSHLKRAGLITVGVGIIGAKKTAAGVKTVAGAAKNQVESVQQITSDYRDARRIKAQREADAQATAEAVAHSEKINAQRKVDAQEDAFASYSENIDRSAENDEAYEMNDAYNLEQAEIQRGVDKDHSKALKINEKFDRVKAKAERAKARKQARREKWAKRADAVKQYARDVKDGFVETKDAAVGAAKNTYEASKDKATETRRRVGAAATNFATRAESAGRGAVEGWKSPSDR